MHFTHDRLPGRIVFGPRRRHDLAAEVERLEPDAVLFIGGKHDVDTIDAASASLSIPTARIIGVRPHVPDADVDAAERILDDLVADGRVVAVSVGGGSATGLAKMLARRRAASIIAVPTTYAGSEMTPIWGTSIDGHKQTGRDLAVLPRTVLYDPELTLPLPPSVSINSACNALAHVVEPMWLEGVPPMVLDLAVVALGSIVDAVRRVADDPRDLEARSDLLLGAHLAGSVLADAGTGPLHKTAHVLGGMFDLDHGAMYAVLLPRLTVHQQASGPSIDRRLVDHLGADPGAAVAELATELGVPTSLAELGLPSDQIDAAAAAVADHAGLDIDAAHSILTD